MNNLLSQLKKKLKWGVPREASAKWGFAMLFTVMIISIILSIALAIADVTYKQTLLSSLARDSQLAFYQADAGVECGMYEAMSGQFARGTNPADNTLPNTISCGNTTLSFDKVNSYTNYYILQQNAGATMPCFSITFDDTDPVKDVVSARGFSTCASTPQQVERGLSVSY